MICGHKRLAKTTFSIKEEEVFDILFCRRCRKVMDLYVTEESCREIALKIKEKG